MSLKWVEKRDLESWLKNLVPKLKRETSRSQRCRLIQSVERQVFREDDFIACSWVSFKFEFVQKVLMGHVFKKNHPGKYKKLASWPATDFQRNLIGWKNQFFLNKYIFRTQLLEERGSWVLHGSQVFEETGGEALICDEKDAFQAKYRIQCFDPFLFTDKWKNPELRFRINQHHEFKKAKEKVDSEDSIPMHRNVLKNLANIEIFHNWDHAFQDCLGWITIMEAGNQNLRYLLRNERLTITERGRIAVELRNGLSYLFNIGLEHNDQKLENVVLFGPKKIPKWIDFGVMHDHTGRESYRRMGYVRRGSKFRHFQSLGKEL